MRVIDTNEVFKTKVCVRSLKEGDAKTEAGGKNIGRAKRRSQP